MSLFREKFREATIGKTAYPTLDTRGIAPKSDEDESVLGFTGRELKVGLGSMVKTGAELFDNAMRPKDMTPSQWEEISRKYGVKDWATKLLLKI